MSGLRAVAAAMLLAGMTFSPVIAQISEPALLESQYPGRSALNGGALTPWGEAQRAAQHGGNPSDAYGAMPVPAPSSSCARYRSFDPASGTFLGRDGRRHPCQ
ncbi:BA14K-like protein [Bradyrhizobium macuxiense]|uniref:Lectin-like protein BA14k n=1 Tax=Bradyrhizobium macuxiense TaxID=1755647 RepID=A0A560MJ41_9BRAD|nr:BA14K family protein [Bradyrhizobium macuxiense]TWC07392.1 BA14K-like protein [Bradyrhizobium macuxiense]